MKRLIFLIKYYRDFGLIDNWIKRKGFEKEYKEFAVRRIHKSVLRSHKWVLFKERFPRAELLWGLRYWGAMILAFFIIQAIFSVIQDIFT